MGRRAIIRRIILAPTAADALDIAEFNVGRTLALAVKATEAANELMRSAHASADEVKELAAVARADARAAKVANTAAATAYTTYGSALAIFEAMKKGAEAAPPEEN